MSSRCPGDPGFDLTPREHAECWPCRLRLDSCPSCLLGVPGAVAVVVGPGRLLMCCPPQAVSCLDARAPLHTVEPLPTGLPAHELLLWLQAERSGRPTHPEPAPGEGPAGGAGGAAVPVAPWAYGPEPWRVGPPLW